MNSLGLNGKHGSGIQDDAQLVFDNLRQSKLVPLLDSLEALSNLGVLGEWFEIFEQAEVLEPILGANALGDEIR